MAGGSREERMLAAIRRVLDRDEEILDLGRCWAAVCRRHVPLLLLGRRQYDAVVTDRRLVLVTRRRRALRPGDVVLVKRFTALMLLEEQPRITLWQQRIRTDTGTTVVIEWPRSTRATGAALAAELPRPARRQAA